MFTFNWSVMQSPRFMRLLIQQPVGLPIDDEYGGRPKFTGGEGGWEVMHLPATRPQPCIPSFL